jgi:serine/threonine-protein kinase
MASRSGAVQEFPRHVGRYELLLPIGSGATATVYLARTKVVGDLHRNVAVKLVHPHLRDELGTDLLDEARVAGAIRHPHVVSVIEADVSPHGAYLALDYVEGDTLAFLARSAPEKRLPLPLVARIVGDMLDGLHAAHQHHDAHGEATRLVHRDLSLRNVLVGIDGLARLTDFGIAKFAGRDARTKTGHAKGTVPYMSPEQAMGKPLDRRSDVWAAGVVVWELLTGRRLFEDDNETSILLEIVQGGPIVMPSALRRELPAEVDDAVRSALTRERDRRCPGVLEHVCEVASHRDVAALVVQLAGDRLDARRRAIADVLAARESEALAQRQFLEEGGTSERAYLAEGPNTTEYRTWGVVLVALVALLVVAWSRVSSERASTELLSMELPSVAPPQAAAASTLKVTANAAIAEIQIGERLPLIVEPKRELAVTLGPEERTTTLTIRARSVDGRRASAEVTPARTAIELTFTAPTKVAPARRPGRGASPYEK